jgi:uncharacterized circularly permuted ATP-grasp superfamily protein/uncharacterized alpha-E superfamily protein
MEFFTPHSSSSPQVPSHPQLVWGLDPATVATRTAQARLLAERILQRDPSGQRARPFTVELSSLRLPPAEWKWLQAGALQRLKAFSALVEDVYGKRRILKDGILPPEIVYEDPLFFPELQGLPQTPDRAIVFAAMDLVQTPSGSWQIVEHRFSTPTGIGRLLQTRRILAASLPEAFRGEAVHPVQWFPARLYEHLTEATARGPSNKQIILLSEGPESSNLQEEQLLAREMGIPIAHSHDLVVRNGRLFLRTIEGLDEVGIVYRRIEPPFLDPVGFASHKFAGIPGLLHCIRQNTVQVLNAPECAVADNRALLRHADAIVRYYCGEAPILKTVPTFYGYDRDQAEWIEDHENTLILKPVCHPGNLLPQSPSGQHPDLKQLLKSDPRRIVGQALPAPTCSTDLGNATPGRTFLRLFLLGGKRPYVLPGGLCRFSPAIPSDTPVRLLRDTWVRTDALSVGIEPLEPHLASPKRPLPSGIAENMYWLGRYLERGLAGCRMLSLVDPWEHRSAPEDQTESILAAGILAALDVEEGEAKRLASMSGFLQPQGHPNSPLSAFSKAQSAVSTLRGSLHESTSLGIDLLFKKTHQLCVGPSEFKRADLDLLKVDYDGIIGNLHRTLPRDSGWHFFVIGQMIENGSILSSLGSAILPKIVRRMDWHLQDEGDLNGFLRLAGCLNLYHQIYHSRAFLDRTLQLIWQSETCPTSFVRILLTLENALLEIHRQSLRQSPSDALVARLRATHDWIKDIEIESILPARTVQPSKEHSLSFLGDHGTFEIQRLCDRLCDFFETFHTALDDRFFCHQRNAGALFHNAFQG